MRVKGLRTRIVSILLSVQISYREPLGPETVELFCLLDCSGSAFIKRNAFTLHCHQPHPDSSRAVMEASVPCSVATPSVAEQFRDQAVLPAAYLTPTTRRTDKGDHPYTIRFKIVSPFLLHISFEIQNWRQFQFHLFLLVTFSVILSDLCLVL